MSDLPNYARVVNDVLDERLSKGDRYYIAIRVAEDMADARAILKMCSPRPTDWNEP